MERRKELLLTQGIKIAKLEGLKKERAMLRELIDTTIKARDKEGFDFLKDIHNAKVKEIDELKQEINEGMEEVDKVMDEVVENMTREFMEGLDIEKILKVVISK